MISIVGALLVVLLVLAVGWVVQDHVGPENAGPCTSVGSAACQPFIQLVRQQLGTRASEITQIQGRSYCGHPVCDQLFGAPGTPFDLVVTVGEYGTATFACGWGWGPSPGQGLPSPGTLATHRYCSLISPAA